MNNKRLLNSYSKTYIPGVIFIVSLFITNFLWQISIVLGFIATLFTLGSFIYFLLNFRHNVRMSRILKLSIEDPEKAIKELQIIKRQSEVQHKNLIKSMANQGSGINELFESYLNTRVAQYNSMYEYIRKENNLK